MGQVTPGNYFVRPLTGVFYSLVSFNKGHIMRDDFTADWAFGFRGTLEKNVRQLCPQFLKSWPLLQSFNFEAYELPHEYLLLVLRDKLNGMPAGPGIPSPFPLSSLPALPPTIEEIPLWQFYIHQTFNLSPSDVGFLVPVHDSGKSDAAADYALFTPQEQFHWHQQFNFIYSTQKQWLESIMKSASSNVTNYNVTGPNARVNVDSTDNSTNTVLTGNAALFQQLRNILIQIPDSTKRAAIASTVDDMEQSVGKPSFTQHYTQFISLAADHVGLFTALLPPITALIGV
jgi:hypothetical protein